MKLLLTSSGITNKSIAKALQSLVKRPFKNLWVTFVPTASTIEDEDKSWLITDMENFRKLGFKGIDIVEIAALPRKEWLPRVKKADILVFGGGNTFYLRDWIKKSGLMKDLPGLLKSRVYVGISAGGIVTADKLSALILYKVYYENLKKVSRNEQGLGLVHFQVRPHLGSKFFPKATVKNLEEISKKIKVPFYAIDDNSAIKVDGKKVEVVSEGKWKKFN